MGSANLRAAPWWWWKARTVRICRETTTMIIGIILSFVSLAYLCWLLFTLAVHTLPLLAGVTAAFAAYNTGSGLIGAVIVGLVAGSVALGAGQLALTTVRSPLIRGAIVLLFAAPAAVAGYHA